MTRITSPLRGWSAPARLALAALNAAALTATAAPYLNSQLPGADANRAKNLARMNCGAQIELVTPQGKHQVGAASLEENTSARPLIMDDETISCPMAEGETTLLISLSKTSLLDRFSFINENGAAQGQLKIAVSNYRLPIDSPKWTAVDGAVTFSNKRLFSLSMLGVEAKYVKLTFQLEKGGRIAGLGLYGATPLAGLSSRRNDFAHVSSTSARSRGIEDVLNFNFANLYANGRVVYVSSGSSELARRMIDDDSMTSFRFAETDPQPTAIVELRGGERLNRVSAVYKTDSGRLDVYLLDELRREPGDLSGIRPVATVTDTDARGKAAVNFEPRGARFVALRWTPAEGRSSSSGFEIAEVNAFGQVPLRVLEALDAPELYASNAPGLIFPGETGPDLSNRLGTLADPPAIPPVSP